MGGKKKIKWRKLPLEHFPSEPEKEAAEDPCRAELTSEEIHSLPYSNETAESTVQYVEPYEPTDGLWYPTACVVYNPPFYSNYMMPLDTSYYYYAMADTIPIQDYVPVPYQEYTSHLPKDPVYLWLPAETVQAPSTAPYWPNRRRRRRDEGYADYALIPERATSNNAEEKDRSKRNGQYVNSRRNSTQSNRKMTSNNFDDCTSISEPNQSCNNSRDTTSLSDPRNEKGPISINKELSSMENNRKKSLELCGIHTKAATERKGPQTVTENLGSENELCPNIGVRTTGIINEHETFCSEFEDISNLSQGCDEDYNLPNKYSLLEREKTKEQKQEKRSQVANDTNLPPGETCATMSPLQNIGEQVNPKPKSVALKQEGLSQLSVVDGSSLTSARDIPQTNSQCSLPDILSTLSKSAANEKTRDSDLSNSRPDSADLDKGRSPKSKSLLSQTSYLSNLLSSEALHNEMELELKQLKSLHSLQANQSIYKLAYDENVTDQSEADSRSPSPIDPESQVPTSLTSAEILIHEAESGSDAGSEDVELLPHRYESETFLNENKHVYVNKLSLAVELLRTQERLPYDDEFKRVVAEMPTGGKRNLGFSEDPWPPSAFAITNQLENNATTTEMAPQSSSDSAIFSDMELDEELCEDAKEAIAQSSEVQDSSGEVRAGYRRFGVQARHYFSPRAALSLNPCFCCILM